jgi:hypothetical protein
MPHDLSGTFRWISPAGVEEASGPLSLLDEALRARSTAEGAIAAAARAAGQMARIQARSDALDLKEHDLKRREELCRSIQSDAIRRFADDVVKLGRRFDEFEQRKIADAIAELPDPDGAAPDDGDLEPKLAKTELEDVLAHDDQNPGDLPNTLETGAPPQLGSYPTLGRELPQLPQIPDISLNAAGDAMPSFVCGRDKRAWKRQQRNRTWQR